MPRRPNKAAENVFLAEVAAGLTDAEAVVLFEETFGRKITLDALRKRRQRLGLKKVGWDGQFLLVKGCELTSLPLTPRDLGQNIETRTVVDAVGNPDILDNEVAPEPVNLER